MNEERILVCIDDGARRRLFRAALTGAPSVEVVGATEAGLRAVRAAAARQPDLILLETARPIEGAKLVGRLRSVAPQAGVICVAPAAHRPRSIAARSLTADRYVDPDAPLAEVIDAVLEFAREHRAQSSAS